MFCLRANLCFNAVTFDLLLGSTALLLSGLKANIHVVQRHLERHWAPRSIAWQRNATKVHEMILSHHALAVLRQFFLTFLRGKSAWMIPTDVHDVSIASHNGTASDISAYRDAPLTLSLDVSYLSQPCQQVLAQRTQIRDRREQRLSPFTGNVSPRCLFQLRGQVFIKEPAVQVGRHLRSYVIGGCEGGDSVEATEFFFQRGQLVGLLWVGLVPSAGMFVSSLK